MRFVRDEQAWLDRRNSLQRRCDKEAAEGMQHLQNMNNDIQLKADNRQQIIQEQILDRRHAQFRHQDDIYDNYTNICTQQSFDAQLKEVNKMKLQHKKANQIHKN